VHLPPTTKEVLSYIFGHEALFQLSRATRLFVASTHMIISRYILLSAVYANTYLKRAPFEQMLARAGCSEVYQYGSAAISESKKLHLPSSTCWTLEMHLKQANVATAYWGHV